MNRPTTSSGRPATAGRPGTSAGASFISEEYSESEDGLFAFDAFGEIPTSDDQFAYGGGGPGAPGLPPTLPPQPAPIHYFPPHIHRQQASRGFTPREDPLLEEDEYEESEYESSDDGDVFAYLPPTTAEQHQAGTAPLSYTPQIFSSPAFVPMTNGASSSNVSPTATEPPMTPSFPPALAHTPSFPPVAHPLFENQPAAPASLPMGGTSIPLGAGSPPMAQSYAMGDLSVPLTPSELDYPISRSVALVSGSALQQASSPMARDSRIENSQVSFPGSVAALPTSERSTEPAYSQSMPHTPIENAGPPREPMVVRAKSLDGGDASHLKRRRLSGHSLPDMDYDEDGYSAMSDSLSKGDKSGRMVYEGSTSQMASAVMMRGASNATSRTNNNGGLGLGGAIVNGEYRMGGDPAMLGFETFEMAAFEEDSPYPEVRASVSNVDDPNMPALTIRMWIIGLSMCILGTAANTLFFFRYPGPQVTPTLMLLIAHPIGKIMAYSLPLWVWTIRVPDGITRFCRRASAPFQRVLKGATAPGSDGGVSKKGQKSDSKSDMVSPSSPPEFFEPWEWEIELNPGPFNLKEHTLIFIMCNVSLNPTYALVASIIARDSYQVALSAGSSLLLVLVTQTVGFGIAGACRRFLVWPASLIWPQNLITCTLLNTLHAEEDDRSGGITRFGFFVWATIGAFVWEFFPGFIFEALSYFSWVCWLKPKNVVVNQLFGTRSGLGMGFLTFDWNQIGYGIGNPLMIPWWAEAHVISAFVLFYWLVCPLLYYTNALNFAYFPMLGSASYDKTGAVYNATKVMSANHDFDPTLYAAYSPIYLSVNYVLNYTLNFALMPCVLVHTALYHGPAMWKGLQKIKSEADDIHAKLMRTYAEVPTWWYLFMFVVSAVLCLVVVAIWDFQLPVWGALLAIVLATIYVIPLGFLYAYTGLYVHLSLISESLAGVLFPGKPLANLVFKAYTQQIHGAAINFVQDAKLGHYTKIPPKSMFIVQVVAIIITSAIQVVVQHSLFTHIPGICNPKQPNHFTCPAVQTTYTSSIIWGVIGPTKLYGAGGLYTSTLYAILGGTFLPIPFWLLQKRYPTVGWLKNLSTPVFLAAAQSLPPAFGINFSSFAIVAFFFQYLIRRRNFRWWSKFTYVLASALDSGTALSLVIIFLTLQLPMNGQISLNWWGNDVISRTLDASFPTYLPIPDGGVPG